MIFLSVIETGRIQKGPDLSFSGIVFSDIVERGNLDDLWVKETMINVRLCFWVLWETFRLSDAQNSEDVEGVTEGWEGRGRIEPDRVLSVSEWNGRNDEEWCTGVVELT